MQSASAKTDKYNCRNSLMKQLFNFIYRMRALFKYNTIQTLPSKRENENLRAKCPKTPGFICLTTTMFGNTNLHRVTRSLPQSKAPT